MPQSIITIMQFASVKSFINSNLIEKKNEKKKYQTQI